MSVEFLINLMQFAQATTRAGRCMALGLDMTIHERINVDDALLEKDDFTGLLQRAVAEAISTDDIVITNNLITDPDDAPKTNVHLHELRMVIAIPIPEIGVIYLDQRIRQGVFRREMVERLNEFGRYLIANDKTNLDLSEFEALYQEFVPAETEE